jgi:hypothetical protein
MTVRSFHALFVATVTRKGGVEAGDTRVTAEEANEGGVMPHGVEKRGSKYAIVDEQTGKTKGKSDTKKKAQASARIRDQRAKD